MSTGILPDETASASNFRGMIMLYAGVTAPDGFFLCNGQAVSRTTYSDLFALIGTAYGAGDGSTTFNVPDFRSAVPVGLGQRIETFDFVDGDVNTSNEQITVPENDFLHNGVAVVLSNSGGALPTGLSATTYYIIRVSSTVVKLATTVANANAGTAVDITAASGGGTHTLTLTLSNRSLGDKGGEETHALSDNQMPSHNHDRRATGVNGGTSFAIADANNIQDSSATGDAGGDEAHPNMPPYVTVNYIIKY